MREVIGENNLITVPENSEFNIRIFGNGNCPDMYQECIQHNNGEKE